jgi:outer membrane receptor for ferrienterochelin and colicin
MFFGIEAEARLELIESIEEAKSSLFMVLNGTKMWFNQDLLEDFQYNNKTTTNLQGAAEFIANASLTYSDNKENPFTATVTANYSSDKIYALGSPEDKENSHVYFNNEIMEKGFTTVDMVLTKKFSKRLSMKLSAKNLLNPAIEQTQEIKSFVTNEVTNEVISSYKKGISVSFGLKINLN